jgi:phenylpyruvate tautomerase PptA (4-oxalocrotonate tautomerase family)
MLPGLAITGVIHAPSEDIQAQSEALRFYCSDTHGHTRYLTHPSVGGGWVRVAQTDSLVNLGTISMRTVRVECGVANRQSHHPDVEVPIAQRLANAGVAHDGVPYSKHALTANGSSVKNQSVRIEPLMPTVKIHVSEGKYDEQRLLRLGNAVQAALEAVLEVPPEDCFRIIHVLPPDHFIHTREFLGLKYSDEFILLEVTFISGRSKEKRLALLKDINNRVVAATGISPDDLQILLYELPGENISFGRGLAQRAHISEGV